jgi:ABC-2 type transport system ATP-binding protein
LIAWKKKKVEELSKGMQQKLQFIATVMPQPELLILDEPFLGLDPINTNLIKDIVMEEKKRGTTIIFSTHQMESAERLCDEIMLINKGRKILSGTIGEVKSQFGRRAVQMNYTGDNSFLYNSPFIADFNDFGNYVEIELLQDVVPHDFLESIISKIKITRFEVMEPSLHDIFIKSVQGEDYIGGTE